jgi:hypothetical protein
MKVLIIGNLNTIFTFEYIEQIIINSNNSIDLSVLTYESRTNTRENIRNFLEQKNIKVYYSELKTPTKVGAQFHPLIILSNIMRFSLVKDYDIVHIHGVSNITFFSNLFLKKITTLILIYYGSDLLRASKV